MRRHDLGSPRMGGSLEPHPRGDWVLYDDVAALVEAAYFEGALAGWMSATPNDWEIRPAWLESDARAALARKEESPDAP